MIDLFDWQLETPVPSHSAEGQLDPSIVIELFDWQLETPIPSHSAEDNKLQMRKILVTSILDSEHEYVDILNILMQVSYLVVES